MTYPRHCSGAPPAGLQDPGIKRHTQGTDTPAAAFLTSLLACGPVPVRDILRQASARGIAKRTLERTKDRLGIRAARMGRGWCWSLASQDRHEQQQHEQQEPETRVPAGLETPAGRPFPGGLVQAREGYRVVRFGMKLR